ncbi:hypothetical protein KNO15_18655 [Leifsonia shinshuensis]|uniref:hypothetical protein n=1 Tax=Leifsonia shinshuensis TaxID=150026 RepID=UPI001F50B35A|nr:hypothetical protein [Leifsonia shinshuensis]MCI0158724.1 hypothetical protein [Leifsonia shinshuensis]
MYTVTRSPGAGYPGAILLTFSTTCAMSAFWWPTDAPLVLAGGAAAFGFVYR